MPHKKKCSGLLKNVSCPQCTKKFSTATNVLQHMNQPSGSCYVATLAEEMDLICEEDADVRDTATSQDGDEDIDMDVFPDHDGRSSTPFDNRQHDPDPYVEAYKGCTEAFPGGEMFMDQFRRDQYAEQRRQNIYFPWASKQEWAFALWLLRSHLSMAAIDHLLSLEIISCDIPAPLKCYYP